MSSKSSLLVPPTDYQHMCLHNLLQVRYDERLGEFTDVERLPSHLFPNDSHADRLLSHYLGHHDELKDQQISGCTCKTYIDCLRKDILYGVRQKRGSVRESLVRRIKQM